MKKHFKRIAIFNWSSLVGATGSKGAGFNSGSAYLFDLDCNAENHNLPQNQWHQISLPCIPDTDNRLLLILAMIPLESMEQTGWCIKTLGGGKELLDSSDSLLPGVAKQGRMM